MLAVGDRNCTGSRVVGTIHRMGRQAPRPASGCGIEAVTAGTFTCGGIVMDVAVPDAGVNSPPWGLVFNIHGGSMSGASMDANTGMATLGTNAGYVIISPTAPYALAGNRFWRPDRDVASVASALLDVVGTSTGRIDRARVHAMGYSMGGFMTWSLLCAVPECVAPSTSFCKLGPFFSFFSFASSSLCHPIMSIIRSSRNPRLPQLQPLSARYNLINK